MLVSMSGEPAFKRSTSMRSYDEGECDAVRM